MARRTEMGRQFDALEAAEAVAPRNRRRQDDIDLEMADAAGDQANEEVRCLLSLLFNI
jgi:hypothetical protein